MIYQTKSYLKFLRKSTNHHGIHSPFVYDLVTKCFYDKTKHPAYKTLKEHRKALYQKKETIDIQDFGKGSKVFSSSYRKVAQIAKRAGVSTKRQQLLFRLAQYFKPNTILELGTSVGLGTVALALGNTQAQVTTVEGCPNTATIAQQYFNKFEIDNIQIKNQEFSTFFKAQNTVAYDLVYIDGGHSLEQTLTNFKELLHRKHNNSIFIFDDIYWSREMTEAWKKIISNPNITVSIDCFYWGIVGFRKEQQKQHFNIRL